MALNKARIGVFGGAFDPPHNAHVALVQAALAQLGLAELRIFPTGDAWHKQRALSGGEHRLAMAQLAFGGLPGVVVDARELRRAGPTYTLDTLRELQQERPEAERVLIMGADQAASLPRWHGWREILGLAVIAVAQRPGATGAGPFDPQALPGLPPGARFETLALAPMDTSATEVRRRAAQAQDLFQLVPPAVARYIDQHNLYRST
ncbi:MAG TPA: nicotinate (nicotinamide) nucleotide adenylyltransferase [Variovorax sp.]|jgi:nicotinate-nucleotide adenylyltransferase|nr:nicotinate (nicotinamide) nucleotide adenylyltransferase [Variovorax sp.]